VRPIDADQIGRVLKGTQREWMACYSPCKLRDELPGSRVHPVARTVPLLNRTQAAVASPHCTKRNATPACRRVTFILIDREPRPALPRARAARTFGNNIAAQANLARLLARRPEDIFVDRSSRARLALTSFGLHATT
jgi:hypothetical protein